MFLSPVQAVRDHEYMGQFTGQSHDPFRVSSRRFEDRNLLNLVANRLGKTVADLKHLQPEALATGPWEDGKRMIRPSQDWRRGDAFVRNVLSRVVSTLVAVLFLIGPMWYLVLNQDILLQLIATTGCVMLFGGLMAVTLSTLEAIFAATLAYAAVLMVFVGAVMDGAE